ncbi:protein kinase domain-containing protein [Haematococcus lacustris]|uniref:Protein kinase domain-containing protein n=1 Tax=Haematococcus lacustris TaxID=44745 RepID=A0A699ZXT3_HAELA|nr:protein kinase domain-containing protein [Haematococcus lacustris]
MAHAAAIDSLASQLAKQLAGASMVLLALVHALTGASLPHPLTLTHGLITGCCGACSAAGVAAGGGGSRVPAMLALCFIVRQLRGLLKTWLNFITAVTGQVAGVEVLSLCALSAATPRCVISTLLSVSSAGLACLSRICRQCHAIQNGWECNTGLDASRTKSGVVNMGPRLVPLWQPGGSAVDISHFKEHDRFRLRFFTPSTEVPLCGHATFASAATLFQAIHEVLYAGDTMKYLMICLPPGTSQQQLEAIQPDFAAMLSCASGEHIRCVILTCRAGRGGAQRPHAGVTSSLGKAQADLSSHPWIAMNTELWTTMLV